MQSLAGPSDTKSQDNTSSSKSFTSSPSHTSSTSFLKRRLDDAFPEEDTDQEEEEISPSKKPRHVAPEILPRIHHLSPPPDSGSRNIAAKKRDHMRKSATRKALLQSKQQSGVLEATNFNQLGDRKKNQLLKMAQTSSQHENHSEALFSPPVAQTQEPKTVPAEENIYVTIADGKYQFDLDAVAYAPSEESDREYETHFKWLAEFNRSFVADIREYVLRNPKYRCLTQEQLCRKMDKFYGEKDVAWNLSWEMVRQNIPLDLPTDNSFDTQLATSAAMAAHFNPLPTGVAEEEIDKYVVKVQRKGIELHRAHHRKYLYKWMEKVRKVRLLDKAEEGGEEEEEEGLAEEAGPAEQDPPLVEQQEEQPVFPAIDPLLLGLGDVPNEIEWPEFPGSL